MNRIRLLMKKDNYQAIAVKYVGVIAAFLVQIVFLKLVSAEEYGVFIQVVASANILGTVCAFGQLTFLTKNISIDQKQSDYQSMLYRLTISLLCAFVLAMLIYFLLNVFNNHLDSGLSGFMDTVPEIVFIIIVLSIALQRIFSGLNRGLGFSVFELFQVHLTRPLIQLFAVMIFVLFFSGFKYNLLVSSFLASAIVVVLVLSIRPIRHLSTSLTDYSNDVISDKAITFSKTENDQLGKSSVRFIRIWQQVRDSMQYTMLNVITAAEKNMDVLIVGFLLGSAQAGIYGFTTRLYRLSNVAQSSLNSVLGAKIAKKYAERDLKGLHHQTNVVTRINIANTVIFFILFLLLASIVLEIINVELLEGYYPLLILSGFAILRSIAGPVSIMSTMTGNQTSALKITLVSLAVGVLLIFTLTQVYGLVGTAIGVSTMTVLRAWMLRKMLNKKISIKT